MHEKVLYIDGNRKKFHRNLYLDTNETVFTKCSTKITSNLCIMALVKVLNSDLASLNSIYNGMAMS